MEAPSLTPRALPAPVDLSFVLRAALAVPPYRFLLGWALCWAAVGAMVAGAILFTGGRMASTPLLGASVLFAEVVGFTALASARLIFPMFARLNLAFRLGLQVFTLFAGTVFGSVAIFASQPLFSLANPRMVLTIVTVNALLAVVVGIALHTYDSMRRQIEASYRALREKEALEREIAIAREVQHELLPRQAPHVEGLELAGVCEPAVGVGGDYYDFLPVSGDRVGLVIADVSGKGIPAALLMAGLQASVRSQAPFEDPPGEILARLNRHLLLSTSAARYATLVFGLYDGATRTLQYSNAGHVPPLHLGPDGATRCVAGGVPLGLFEGARYGQGSRVLQRGDLLAFYTDGVVETPGPGDEEYGEERLVALLQRHRELPLPELLRIVLDDRARWAAGAAPHDDVTLVLARAA